MIASLFGKISLKKEKFIVLETNGVGFKVFLSRKSLNTIGSRSDLKVFCHLNVRENALDLYGFLNQEELDLFEEVSGISGIGPKAALEVSSFGSLEKLEEAIRSENEKAMEEIFIIGKKKAQKIILEISGKMKTDFKKKSKTVDEVEEALVNLGFPRQRAKEALREIPEQIKGVEEKIKEALKILGKNNRPRA